MELVILIVLFAIVGFIWIICKLLSDKEEDNTIHITGTFTIKPIDDPNDIIESDEHNEEQP
jgi:hypothetical protein